MKELFDVWHRASPITYTRSRLMDILGKEGLTDMYSWLQLMDTEGCPRKTEISQLMDTPRSARSLSPAAPNSYGCASPAPSSSSSYLRPHSAGGHLNSPYSW